MSPTLETEIFNLVIPRNDNSEVLLKPSNGNYSLPQIEIPKRRRIAEFLTKRVKEMWGVDAICLFDPIWEDGGIRFDRPLNYQVLALRDAAGKPPAQLEWVKRSLIVTDTLASAAQLQALERSLYLADSFNSGTRPGPFANAGWLEDLVAWMEPHLRPLGLALTGSFKQLNASPFFNLIRFETDGVAVWFKAVGEPNVREYEITKQLGENHSQYLPRIIGTRPEWHGWLMLEADGRSPDHNTPLGQWQRVAKTFARLQIECIGNAAHLLEVGCKDLRVATLIQRIDLFVERMNELMQEQPVEPPRRLTRFELSELGNKLKDACHCMQQAGLPDSLFHGDFNPGNVRLSAERCVFLDWAEGCLGPPFLTLEYLIEFLRKVGLGLPEHEQHLRRSYARCWGAVASPAQISEAMQFAPSLAVFSYAVSSAAWESPELTREIRIAKYLRSLTRRLCKELERLRRPELCLR
jgi:hypothetical protein